MAGRGRRACEPVISPSGTSWSAAAIVLDLDGVLLDSGAGERATWRWWARHHGLPPDEVAATAVGRRPRDVVVELLGEAVDVDTEVAALDRRRTVLLRSARRPRGVGGFVRSVPVNRLAVVTSAGLEVAQRSLRRARVEPPNVLITADDADGGRPEPVAHEAAARALAVAPPRCLAVERTAVGIRAAKTAGFVVVALSPTRDVGALPGADGYVHELASLRVTPTGDGLEVSVSRDPVRLG